jgi:hypothetical protein
MSRSWFECWRNPSEFFCAASAQVKPITENDPPDYLRDAYVAGLFARRWNYHNRCEVRLIAAQDRFPDAELRELREGHNHPMKLEIAIADKLDRRIWQEQKEWAEMYKRGESLPVDSPAARREQAREAIPRICKQKVKHYLGTEKGDKKVPPIRLRPGELGRS